jgi:hypothetical protein
MYWGRWEYCNQSLAGNNFFISLKSNGLLFTSSEFTRYRIEYLI